MRLARAVASTVGCALAVLGLVACGAPAGEPAPPTADQLEAMRDAQAQRWWDDLQPGVAMPDLPVIEMLPAAEAMDRQTECLDDAHLPGVTVDGPGRWSFEGGTLGDSVFNRVQTQLWVCAQQFPSETETANLLSSDQLAWLYDFYLERYRPCAATLGIDLVDFPTREEFVGTVGGYATWIPYDVSLEPHPTTEEEWQVLAQRCPLPDMLSGYGLPGYPVEAPSS